MFRNIKIRARMLISYGIIIILLLIASVIALFMLQKVGTNLTNFYHNNYTVTVEAWKARRSMQAARADIMQSILETDQAATEQLIEQAEQELALMRGTFPIIRERFRGDIELVSQVENVLEEAIPYRDQIFELTRENKKTEAAKLVNEKYVPLLDKMGDLLSQISETAGKNAKTMVEQGNTFVFTAIAVVCVVAGVSIVLAVALGVYIADGICKPVTELEKAAADISAGKLDTDISYQSGDELGRLADSMRATINDLRFYIQDFGYVMAELSKGNLTVNTKAEYQGNFADLQHSIMTLTEALNDILRRLNESAEQVASGSEQVSFGAQELSRGASEQAASIEEVGDAIAMVSCQVKNNEDNAMQARLEARRVEEEMTASNQKMLDMISAMKDINETSGAIRKIIKTIENIAFQTNILSLNAAVEAARAGEAGKGFGAVADEVRNLAAKSAEASKSTAQLIQNAVAAVEKGTLIADETAKALVISVENVNNVACRVNEISEASTMQTESIIQINESIAQISEVVQSNSATAEESAAASEELSAQSQLLIGLAGRFKLR